MPSIVLQTKNNGANNRGMHS